MCLPFNTVNGQEQPVPKSPLARALRRPNRVLKALWSNENGLSAVEFALLAPPLLLGLLATADLGLAQSQRMSMDHVLRAGAQSAISDPGTESVLKVTTSTAAPEFSLAADPEAPEPGNLSLTVSRLAACPEQIDTAVATSTTCVGGQPTVIYYALSARMEYTGMILPAMQLESALQVRVR